MRRRLVVAGLLAAAFGFGLPWAAAYHAPAHDMARPGARCVQAPSLVPSWEWVYAAANGTERHVEVLNVRKATSGYGSWNMTTVGYAEISGPDKVAWGRVTRFNQDTPYAWATIVRDRWTAGSPAQTVHWYDPPLQTDHHERGTCPGRQWYVDTQHTTVDGETMTGVPVREVWKVRVDDWTNLTVAAGTFEVLPVQAVRLGDGWAVTTYWSPDVMAPARVEEGLLDAPPVERWDLAEYILDSRPVAVIRAEPEHPVVGDTVTLDGTASWDADGPIVGHRWEIDGASHEGATVTARATREGGLDVRLFVTDTTGRTATVGVVLAVMPNPATALQILGPTAARVGEVVRLQAIATFDSVRVWWTVAGEIVGEGPVYAFRVQAPVEVVATAIHPDGRAYHANHTVVLGNSEQAGAAHAGGTARTLAPGSNGSPESLGSILAPLEGNVVASKTNVRIRATIRSELLVDGDLRWSGAGPGALVPVSLSAGRHEIELRDATTGAVFDAVNVTAQAPQLGHTSSQARTGVRGVTLSPLWLAAALVPFVCRRSRLRG